MKNSNWIRYILLFTLFIIFIFPLYWMIITALKQPSEVFSLIPKWLPKHWTFQNFKDVFSIVPFGRYYFNTIIFVFGLLGIQLVTVTLAAYAFARMDFKFKDILFIILLIQLMIAPQTLSLIHI